MKKILIVDDEEKIRRLVEVTLMSDDHRVLEAENGKEAIEIAKAEKPELIIMDIMMPGGMDGLEATRLLKNDPETKDCYILILTAMGQQTDRKKGFEVGADDYFAKPFSPLDLLKKVEEVLG